MSVEDKIDRLIEGQKSLDASVAQQHKDQTAHLESMIEKHEKHHHPEMNPDHAEQHKRYGGWLRRIDGAWDKVFGALALFALGAIGYGFIAIMHDKIGGS